MPMLTTALPLQDLLEFYDKHISPDTSGLRCHMSCEVQGGQTSTPEATMPLVSSQQERKHQQRLGQEPLEGKVERMGAAVGGDKSSHAAGKRARHHGTASVGGLSETSTSTDSDPGVDGVNVLLRAAALVSDSNLALLQQSLSSFPKRQPASVLVLPA